MTASLKFLRNLLVVAGVVSLLGIGWIYRPVSPRPWTDADKEILLSLALSSLPALAPDASNAVADNADAVIMGNRLFFDTRLSANGEVSCAICHQPDINFTDGRQKGRGVGTSKRNTRGIVGVAYSPWLYWDGRRDSLWAQALSPMEDPNEHASNRMHIVRLVTEESAYRTLYQQLFGAAPDFSDRDRFPANAAPFGQYEATWRDMSHADRELVNVAFANLGKAIAAYERTLLPEETRFDRYVEAVVAGDLELQGQLLSKQEILGLQLFVGKARCTECHNGPLFTNNEFHNTGVISFPQELPDRGRIDGVREVQLNEFNCLGEYSDDPLRSCPELSFVRTGVELIGATRTPTLRGISLTAPYMHQGQLATLSDVMTHYNRAVDAMIGHNEAEPLSLTWPELDRLEAFLLTLGPGD